jgi:hypothetical protein
MHSSEIAFVFYKHRFCINLGWVSMCARFASLGGIIINGLSGKIVIVSTHLNFQSCHAHCRKTKFKGHMSWTPKSSNLHVIKPSRYSSLFRNLFLKRIQQKNTSWTIHFTPSMINDGACSSINAEHLRLLDVLMWNSTVRRGVATNGP